ncbi:MAG: sulfurtransferase TusB [Beggiatoa sp. IS2]|jgi:tRNA 2-thiouridine synthesizing protein B|nr:MAG: sulfurtransferase TusB [Beggiatoa sp. IS2]
MLHTINKSPFEKNAVESCLRFARQGHTVLLFEDAVYAALQGTRFEGQMKNALSKLSICVLLADLEARGMKADNVIAGIKTIDYARFVDLVVENKSVQAWL